LTNKNTKNGLFDSFWVKHLNEHSGVKARWTAVGKLLALASACRWCALLWS